MSARVEPLRDFLTLRLQLLATAWPDDKHSIARQFSAVIIRRFETSRRQKIFARCIAGIENFSPGARLPLRHITKHVGNQRLGCRLRFRTACDVHLAEQDHPAAFAIFHQRAYCRLNPPSTIGKKSPQAGFSIRAEATFP